jgi:hypothetical protein
MLPVTTRELNDTLGTEKVEGLIVRNITQYRENNFVGFGILTESYLLGCKVQSYIPEDRTLERISALNILGSERSSFC